MFNALISELAIVTVSPGKTFTEPVSVKVTIAFAPLLLTAILVIASAIVLVAAIPLIVTRSPTAKRSVAELVVIVATVPLDATTHCVMVRLTAELSAATRMRSALSFKELPPN